VINHMLLCVLINHRYNFEPCW